MDFLYNRWYAAAWPNEIGGAKPFKRTILGEEIVFYRKKDGAVVGVSSRCPHRFAPLDYGDIAGDNIRCRYHGLEFGPSGKCVVNPDGSAAPSMSVKSYSVVEKDSMIWIWIGDQAPTAPPEWLNLDPAFGGASRGMVHIKCNYHLINDNLLDHAHASHLHEFLKSDAMISELKLEIKDEGERIYVNALAPNAPPNPFFSRLLRGNASNIDQVVSARWDAPSTITTMASATPVGRPKEEGARAGTIHIMTPETLESTFYFFYNVRDSVLEDHELSEKTRASVHYIIDAEDKWMLEAQQKQLGGQDFMELKPVLMPQDRGAALCRRRMTQLVADQGGPEKKSKAGHAA